MTEFSELEKEMLRYMVQLHESQNLCINSWLSKLFNDNISLNHIPGDKPFQYRIDIKYLGVSENVLLSKIKYFQFLVERLEITHLIKLDILGNNEFKFDELDSKEEYTLRAFSNNGILYNFFSMKGNSPILISHYIVELVENKFKTQEQLRFDQQLRDADKKHAETMRNSQKQVLYSQLAFGASILALIVSLTVGIIQICGGTKIDKCQFNQIQQTIEQKTLPDVIKTEMTKDTLTS